MPLIFISHAAADKPLADAIFDLLQTGCDLSREHIFCTSVDGAGIEIGEEFVTWIEASLKNSDLALLLITPNYFASQFCIAEMGAAWALGKKVFPMVLPDRPRGVGGVMLGRQTAALDGPGLDSLRDEIATVHQPAAAATARWNMKRDDFLEQFPPIVQNLPAPKIVPFEELEAERVKLQGAKEVVHSLQKENRSQTEMIDRLKEAKDAGEVARIQGELQPSDERFGQLVDDVRRQLNRLSGVEGRCILASLRDEPWAPENWDYYRTDIDHAMQSEWIIDYDNCYQANEKHPRLKPAFAALESLDAMIRNDLAPELQEQMEKDLECLLDVENRQFWDEILYKGHFFPS